MRLRVKTILHNLQEFSSSFSSSFFTYTVASAANLVATYALMLLMVNVLSKEQYGQYGIYISLFSILLIFINFGHKELIFKYTSANQLKQSSSALMPAFKSFYQWNIFLLGLMQLLLLVDMTIYAAAMMFLVNSWMITFAAYHRGNAAYTKDAWALPLQRLLWLFFSLLGYFIVNDLNLVMLFFFGLMATTVCIIWLYLPINKLCTFSLNYNTMISKSSASSKSKQFKLLLSYLVVETSSVLYLKSDVLLLRFFESNLVDIAHYFFAIQIFEIAALVLMPMGYFYLNRLNRLELEKRTKVSIIPMVLIILAFTSVMHGSFALFAPSIFSFAAPKYVESISIIFWVMCSLYPVAINILLSSQLIVENKEHIYAKICFIALTFNVAANVIFIPSLGLTGVITIKFLTELLILSLLLYACKPKEYLVHS